jgi:hypothetical protein
MSGTRQALLNEAAQKAPPTVVEAAARVLRAAGSPLQAAFLARALNALARLMSALDDRALGNAAGASSDYAVLVQALTEDEAVAALRRDDPLAPARLRGLVARERLLEAEGGVLSAAEVAARLRLTRQAVDKRRRAGRLIGLTQGRRGYVYPAWQFSPEGGTLPGLEEVLAELQGHGRWMQAAFMLSGDARLGGETPLAELRRGHVEAVRRAARAYGEQGAA